MGCGASAASSGNHLLPRNGIHPMTAEMIELPPRHATPISGDALQQFIQVENAIHELEKGYDIDSFNVKQEQLENLEHAMVQLMEVKDQLLEEPERLQQQAGLPATTSTKEFLESNQNGSGPMSPVHERILDSLNRQEIVAAELASVMQQRASIQQELEAASERGAQINALHAKRDQILDAIFEGQYGSDTERRMEKELDWFLEQKHHVDSAYFRWKQAQKLSREAVAQMTEAIQKWKSLASIPLSETRERYYCAAEVRNLLVSSSQNVHGAIRYLPNIDVPYCGGGELETMDKAISFIFTDMQSPERYQHALNCYQTSYKRVAALNQWLTQVLAQSITDDMTEVNNNCKNKATELRNERVRLIRNRIRELTGQDPVVDSWDKVASLELRDSGVDSELGESVSNEELSRLFNRTGTSSTTPDPTPDLMVMPTPLPSADLAPMPQHHEIFGRIEQLRHQHNQDVHEFSRSQKLTQARMTQGLKDKLQQRRSRRSRMEMHSRQMEALKEH